jgi:tungstate transport system ATP-binding protein
MSVDSMTAIVELRGASVCYGSRVALAGVDLRVARGEFIAVVGANGSGKTTLLRALHGLVPLAAGERRLPDPGAHVAMLFQRPFLVRMSARGNLELALWLAGVPRRERRDRAAQALALVGLAADAQRAARELSVGQQQRLALARAWALQPDLLLLDEPTASLDPSGARDVERRVADIAARGVAVLMVSHDAAQVRRLARRVVLLEHGRVRADVDTRSFFEGARSPSAAHFVPADLPWG